MQALKYAARFVVVDLFGGFIYFLPWWYGAGRKRIQRSLFDAVRDMVRNLHLKTLAKYLFSPMYGYTDWQSRIISIAVRLVHFTLLTTITVLYIVVITVALVVWLVFPLFVLYNIGFQLDLIPFNLYIWLWPEWSF